METKEACLKHVSNINDVKLGQVILLDSGNLRCHYLIHGVGGYFTRFKYSILQSQKCFVYNSIRKIILVLEISKCSNHDLP